ncbi:MAG TPA: hypothetical protein VFU93_00670 [Acidimicrobiales bacterium]|nr:hypothetical protein [Acidimicrobiales bacterium]
MDTDDKRRVGRSEVDALIRRLLVVDVDPDRAMIEEEIVRRRLAVS